VLAAARERPGGYLTLSLGGSLTLAANVAVLAVD
jgi:hypothetical protein